MKPVAGDRLLPIVQRHCRARRGLPVLVVDDDRSTRELVVRMLQKEGVDAVEAENGRYALEQLRKTQAALIVLDMEMPEMDGPGLLRCIQENEVWKRIPVVVVTSMDLSPALRQSLTGNVVLILQKGQFTKERLFKEIRDRLTVPPMPAAARTVSVPQS
jgi:CheY-like chemotaxis protein